MIAFSPILAAAQGMRAVACAGLVVVFAADALAQGGAQSQPDAVAARVDGQAIYVSDVRDAMAQLPPEYLNMPMETLYRAVVEQLIDRQLTVRRAREQNLGDDLEVQKSLKQFEARVLEQFYLRRTVERKVTDEAIARRYERDKDKLVRDKKVRARHILVKSREEAVEVLREISRGKDFVALAREKSIGPSKEQGGDLGFFTREQMLPAFSDMAFSLKKGEVARAPVQTRYGWHVIRVEDIQEAAAPPLAEVKDELRAKMTEELIDAELKRLREGAKIERFSLDGRPMAPEGPALAPTPAAGPTR